MMSSSPIQAFKHDLGDQKMEGTSNQDEEVVRSINDSIEAMFVDVIGNQEISQEERTINSSIKAMIDDVPPLFPEYSIHRVPERLRNVNEAAYTPMVVSIGPYYHGNEKYKTMEYHKLRYLYINLLRDHSRPLHEYVKSALGLERLAREFYADTIIFTKEEFVKMMLVDGFFIVELIRQFHDSRLRNNLDPIFKNPWIFNAVHRDLLLLENQLPFFVLESLFTLINNVTDIRELAKSFLCHYQPISEGLTKIVAGHHLLHLLQKAFISPRHQQGPFPRNNKDLAFIPSATELHEAGIKFHGEASRHLLDVKFTDGVVQVPTLLVDDRTESLLRNLIALEQSHHSSSFINDLGQNLAFTRAPEFQNQRYGGSTSTPVTDYVTLMDCLINTSADVALLRDSGIIRNWLGDNEEVAQLFNKLRSGINACSTEFYFYKLFADVNEFYKTRWHALKAKLKRDYFNTPWASLSFVAAVFLLICTLVQTVCSIIQVVQK